MWARENFMVTTFAEIALEHFQLLRMNYQRLVELDSMCGEAVEFLHEIRSHYVITITFAAMSLEAFLNNYGAEKMGDDYFYSHFEMRPAFSKFQKISSEIFNTSVDNDGKIHKLMCALFKARNELVHSKSRRFVGMNKEEYEKYQQPLASGKGSDDWMLSQRVNLEEERVLLEKAFSALFALKEVANFIDAHDDSAYALVKLLCSGLYVDGDREKCARIQSVQRSLEVEPLQYF